MNHLFARFASVLLLLAACAPAATVPAQVAALPDELLAFGGAVGGALPVGAAERGYVFVGSAGDVVSITMDSDTTLRLSLYAPDASLAATGERRLQATLERNGAYRVVVGRDDTTSDAVYALSLATLPTATPSATPLPPTATLTPTPTATPTPTPIYAALGTYLGELSGSQTVTGEFANVGQRFVFSLTSSVARALSARLTTLGEGIDPALTLFDANGQSLATDEEGGGGDTPLLTVQLEGGTAYYLQARADVNGGAFSLSISLDAQAQTPIVTPAPTTVPPVVFIPTPAVGEGQLFANSPAAGRLARPGDFARYTLLAQAGDVITLGAYPVAGSSLRPALELFDEEGVSLVQTGTLADGKALLPAVVIPTTGIYSAFVTGTDDTTGDFVISFGRGGAFIEDYRGEIAVNVPMQSSIGRGGRDVWALRLNAGDRLTATVVSTDGALDPALELIAPDGSRIVYNDDLPGDPSAAFGDVTVSNAGTYLLRVTGENALTAGGYTLVWRYLAAAPTPTPPPASVLLMAVDGQLDEGGEARYVFQGGTSERVRVEVIAEGALDPLALLIAPDGSTLIEVDDSADGLNPRFEVELPADGTYTLVVRGYGAGGGAFTARVVRLIF